MAQPPIPDEIAQWITQLHWGPHHFQWHVERRWDRFVALAPAVIQYAKSQGWHRYPIQEGQAGNGLEFLAMHRAMIRALRKKFPAHASLFDGWDTVPVLPDDPGNPVPPNPDDPGSTRPLHPKLREGIARIEGSPASFGSDDEFGIFIETTDRPTPEDPIADSPDLSAGVHGRLHTRFDDPNDPSIRMASPLVNIFNQMFWRLHGWIDASWTRYRQAKGFSESDEDYSEAQRKGALHMGVADILYPGEQEGFLSGVLDHRHVLRHIPHHPPLEVPPEIMQQVIEVLYSCPPLPMPVEVE